MRAQAREKGTIESGFERVPEGWHVFTVDDGIEHLLAKKKEGEEDQKVAVNKQGDQLWKISLFIDDEDDEGNGIKLDLIPAENKRGEQMVTDLLGATGLFTAFEKAFPGDQSIFTDKVMEKVKGKLPGQMLRGKVKWNPNKSDPDNPYANLVGFGKMSDTFEQLEKDLFPAKKGGVKKEAAKTAPVVDDEPF